MQFKLQIQNATLNYIYKKIQIQSKPPQPYHVRYLYQNASLKQDPLSTNWIIPNFPIPLISLPKATKTKLLSPHAHEYPVYNPNLHPTNMA